MNKKIVALLAAAVCAVAVLVLFFIKGEHVKLGDVNKAVINYENGTVSVNESLTKEEISLISDIFEDKELYSDKPSCGFSDEISIVINDGQTFCIARDTCAIIYLKEKNLYFSVSEKDIELIHGIFENHGGKFPCV